MSDDPRRLGKDEVLIRRLPPSYLTPDEAGTGSRMTTNAFVDNDDDGTSVYVKSKLQALGIEDHTVASSHGPGWALAEVTVHELEALGLYAIYDPDPEDTQFGEAHGVIKGKPPGARGSKTMRKLAKAARLRVV